MIGKYRMRTDLAMENQEKFERDHVEISGVEIEKKKRKARLYFRRRPYFLKLRLSHTSHREPGQVSKRIQELPAAKSRKERCIFGY